MINQPHCFYFLFCSSLLVAQGDHFSHPRKVYSKSTIRVLSQMTFTLWCWVFLMRHETVLMALARVSQMCTWRGDEQNDRFVFELFLLVCVWWTLRVSPFTHDKKTSCWVEIWRNVAVIRRDVQVKAQGQWWNPTLCEQCVSLYHVIQCSPGLLTFSSCMCWI